MKKLIIVEKPSVGMDYAKALAVSGKHDGYIENDEWIITWCVGHLITLSYPDKYDEKYKKWNLSDLPFLPKEYKYEVIDGVKKQFNIVSGLLNRPDVSVIYNGGDSAREGEYIMRLVYMMAGLKNKPIKRIWIDSQTDDEIRRGIKEAKDSTKYDLLSESAFMRGIEDYSMGINLSRALSCKYANSFVDENNNKLTIAVGRVMTCVMGMVIDREREIKAFVPTDYYKIDAIHQDIDFTSHWKASENSKLYLKDDLYNESGFKKREDAVSLVDKLSKDKKLFVVSVGHTTEKKYAPLLFNLAELQNECTRLFKIDPDKTLSIVQTLYEKKLTTYPRTDARVISSAVAKVIDKNINGLVGVACISKYASYILKKGLHLNVSKTKYCNDKKISDHYAIIPTGVNTGPGEAYEELADIEKDVYELICRRFIAIFLPPAEYEKNEVVLIHSTKELFYASEKLLIKQGFKAIYNLKDDEQTTPHLRTINKGDVVSADFVINAATTKPPSRYNSGSMILAMENAGKLIEDEELRSQIKGSGIGTSATRAATIKKLCDKKYIQLNKKTQILTPTKIGVKLYDIVKENVPAMLSPKMTASWEQGLSLIENGNITKQEYLEKFEDFIKKSVDRIKAG